MTPSDLFLQWRKSSCSAQNNNCVEVAATAFGMVAIRDSKDSGGPMLTFSTKAWREFLARMRGGGVGSRP